MSRRVDLFSEGTCVTCGLVSGESGTNADSAWVWAKDHMEAHCFHKVAVVLRARMVELNEGEKSAWENTVARFRQQAGMIP